MNDCFVPTIKLNCAICRRNDIVEVVYRKLALNLRENGIPGMRLVSVRQMAKLLGIAPQTVQKVYNHLEADGMIARRPGRRIYRLNGRTEQSHCLGIILPVSFARYFQPGTEYGQRHFRMYSGIVDRAAELGFSTFPIQLPSPNAAGEEIETALLRIRQKCCALIHFGDRGYSIDRPLQKVIECEDMAQISFNCVFERKNIGAVTFDSAYAVSMFVSYIREYGHSRFVFVLPGHCKHPPLVRYQLQYREEMKELFRQAGVPDEDFSFLAYAEDNRNTLLQEFRKLLKAKDPPTVFWCRNDETAMKLLALIREEGFQVPQDFSVMGFNNLYESEHSDPPLSTFNNPFYEMGIALTDRLMLYLKDGINEHNRLVRIPPFLVPRSSVGPNRIKLNY